MWPKLGKLCSLRPRHGPPTVAAKRLTGESVGAQAGDPLHAAARAAAASQVRHGHGAGVRRAFPLRSARRHRAALRRAELARQRHARPDDHHRPLQAHAGRGGPVLVARAGLPEWHVDVGHAWELDQLHDRDEEGLPVQRESSPPFQSLFSVLCSLLLSPFLSLPLLLGSLFAPVQTRDAERCGG